MMLMNSSRTTRVAGIMAAGRGQRLGAISKSKPLTIVDGRPLIDHVLTQCAQAEIDSVLVAIREDDSELADHLNRESRFPGGVRDVLVAPGSGTGVAVHTLVREIGPGPCLISTADTIAPFGTYRRLLEYVSKLPKQVFGAFLATSYIRDEDPIWVVSDEHGRVRTLAKGIQPTNIVFANVRWLSAEASHRIASMTVPKGSRDTMIMAELLQKPDCDFRVYVENPVFDIDDPADLEAAAEWLGQQRSEAQGVGDGRPYGER